LPRLDSLKNLENFSSTELIWFAIDPSSGAACHRSQYARLFEPESTAAIRGELDAFFRVQSVRAASASPGSSAGRALSPRGNDDDASAASDALAPNGAVSSTKHLATPLRLDRWRTAELVLLALAALVALGALAGVFASCYLWSK